MKIICLGDSLTYGYGVLRKDTWVTLCSNEETQCINKGVNGDTTGGMLARFDVDVLSFHPDAALIMGGANDRFYSGSFGTAKSNLMAMAHRCCAERIEPVIGIPILLCPPVREGWSELIDPAFYGDYDAFCAEILHLCTVFGFETVDFRTAFSKAIAAAGEPSAAFYLTDGLHPNVRGHRMLAEIMTGAIARL